MVHLPPLPGSPGYLERGWPRLEALLEPALTDAQRYRQVGFDGLIVENFGDVPFFKKPPPETVAAMTRSLLAVRQACPELILGVNVLRNGARAALGCAVAAGASFVRVNVHAGVAAADQGLLEGQAAETTRLRALLGAGPSGPQPVAILADVHVKHARPLDSQDVGAAAADAAARGRADGVIVSGRHTGGPARREDLEQALTALTRLERDGQGPGLWLGSGLTPESCPELVPLLAAGRGGAIVGSYCKRAGRVSEPVDSARAQALAEAFRTAAARA